MPTFNLFKNNGPLVDFKHKSIEDLKNMTPDEIRGLQTKDIGYYQRKFITDSNEFSDDQINAIDQLLSLKTKEKVGSNQHVNYGGKTRRRRKNKKSKKGGRKSRRRGGRKSRK
jgi:hypothetical protein